MEIIDVECSKLNRLYMEKNAEKFARSFGDLLGLPARVRKEAEYLQKTQSPGLKAQIRIEEGKSHLVSCIYETNCGIYCDFKKRI